MQLILSTYKKKLQQSLKPIKDSLLNVLNEPRHFVWRLSKSLTFITDYWNQWNMI